MSNEFGAWVVLPNGKVLKGAWRQSEGRFVIMREPHRLGPGERTMRQSGETRPGKVPLPVIGRVHRPPLVTGVAHVVRLLKVC